VRGFFGKKERELLSHLSPLVQCMQLKPITVIIVLLLVAASLLASGCTTSTTNQTGTEILPTYPNKRLNYGQLFGRVSCEPGWQNGTKYLPTDGSGSTTFYDCSGNTVNYPTGTSNQLQYLVKNGWDIELDPTSYMLSSYPRELATLGAGHTQMDAFKNTYVAQEHVCCHDG